MAKKLKLILAAFVAFFALGAVSVMSSPAVQAEGLEGTEGIVLQVSPTKQKLSLKPGSSYVGTFAVQNTGTEPFTYSVSVAPYSVTSDNYADTDYETMTAYTQIAEWVTFDSKTEKGTVQPGGSVDVTYQVNVPKDVPAGGQYAVLMAQTDSGNTDDATVNVVHRVGMILYATVPGETRETGEIIKNTVNSFYFNPPITVSSLVKNTGNVEQTATYTVKIYPLFSNEAIFSNVEDPEKERSLDVIPDTSRFKSISWDGAPRIGIFSVEQTIEFAGETSTVQKLVLICPLWLIFIIFALLFFIIFWLVSRSRDRKRAARHAAGQSSVKSTSKDEKSSSTKSEKED